MGEESKSQGTIAAILNALPSDIKGALSGMLLFAAFVAMMFALVNMPAFFKNLASSTASKEPCWELKETEGMTIKFNKCTGEALQLEIKIDAALLSKK